MRYATYSAQENPAYPICFLVPTIRKDDIRKAYVDPFNLDPEEVLVLTLHQSQTKKKTPVAEIKQYITEELAGALNDVGVQYLLVTDSDYFKILTGAAKVEANLGYVMDSAFGPWKVIYIPSYRAIFYDPDKVKAKIEAGITAMIDHRAGGYQDPGAGIIKFAAYPQTDEEIEDWLDHLLKEKEELTCDIEAFSLKHYDAGIGTITFCWNQEEGIAFPVDYQAIDETEGLHGAFVKNDYRRALLKTFFSRAREMGIKLVWHNIGYDAYVLIYQLFMEHILDNEGLLEGLEILLGGDWDDTKLITYLATNSCAGNKLGLKDQAQEFAGNYAVEEIKDIRRTPLPELLQYNLVDGLSTWFVKAKHWGTMVADQQLDIYETLFKPAMVDIIQMQLTGLPVNMAKVKEARTKLEADRDQALARMNATYAVQAFTYRLREEHVAKRNAELKKKRITMQDDEVQKVVFNPGSAPQLQQLLFEVLGLPVLGLTDSKLPSTEGDILKALKHHTDDADVKELLDGLIDYKAVAIILSTFIPAMENAQQGPDGWHYLFGNFNLGGTLSGRLSSSKPNLQNIPSSGTRYAKIIKECFEAPPGWLFTGLDFNSLEDRISALTTKDPNKLKVYTDGYDGHSLRAHAYFGDQMPDIDPNSVVSINSIQDKYKPLRQDSKAPTFALTYQGTYVTLMNNCGFDMEKAKLVEARYHEMYVVSDQWVAAKLDEATSTGFITAAFGLRLRTPLLKQVIRGTSKTPYEAEAEGRTAGNALGQSWCLLNTRAGVEFNRKVRTGPYRNAIRPCAQIHDAQYFLMKDDIGAIQYANEHLVKAVQWQEHPDIAHDEVKLGGELSIFWPNWSKEMGIPNNATQAQIYEAIEKHMSKVGSC